MKTDCAVQMGEFPKLIFPLIIRNNENVFLVDSRFV